MKTKTFYTVLYDTMSTELFMGYTDNEFIINEIIKNDELKLYIIYEFECTYEELVDEIYENLSIELDKENHRLKLYRSKDKTTYIISSEIQLDEVICETGCYDDTLQRTIKAFIKLQSEYKSFFKNEEVLQFVNYIYAKYLCPDIFKFYGTDNPDRLDDLSIDKVKLLAKQGYVGTIKSPWR